jgi:hypothetical protein
MNVKSTYELTEIPASLIDRCGVSTDRFAFVSLESSAPNPHEAHSAAEFVAQLRGLRAWSGLTYRQLARRAMERGEVLPPSTVAAALNRETLPRTDLVGALVRACGGDDDTVEAWVGTRRRLAVEEGMAPAAVEQVPSPGWGDHAADPRSESSRSGPGIGRTRGRGWSRAVCEVPGG